MKLATKNDRPLVSNIIAEAFRDNQNINALLRPSRDENVRQQRIKYLAEYAFDFAFRRKGVFLSADEQGVIIAYEQRQAKKDFWDILSQIKFIILALNLKKIFEISTREAALKDIRPQQGNYLYVWFLAATHKGQRQQTAYELRDAIFQYAQARQLPIYAETTIPRVKTVYERFGFTTYACLERNIATWLMKRDIINF